MENLIPSAKPLTWIGCTYGSLRLGNRLDAKKKVMFQASADAKLQAMALPDQGLRKTAWLSCICTDARRAVDFSP